MTTCRNLFSTPGLEGQALQEKVEEQFPDGACETVKVSDHSPGPVGDNETLTRFVFAPIHVDEKGMPVSTAFSDAWKFDLSVFREELASDAELHLAIAQIKDIGLRKTPPVPRKVVAVMATRAGGIRAETVNPAESQASARTAMTPQKVRKRLFDLFITVHAYRSGIDDVKPAQAA
jgi:hypothetical protein